MPRIRGQADPVVRRVGQWVPYEQPEAPTVNLKSMTRAELDAHAESVGVDPSGYSTKGDLQRALEKA